MEAFYAIQQLTEFIVITLDITAPRRVTKASWRITIVQRFRINFCSAPILVSSVCIGQEVSIVVFKTMKKTCERNPYNPSRRFKYEAVRKKNRLIYLLSMHSDA